MAGRSQGVVLSFLYWSLRRLLELVVLRVRSEREKEIEILLLRHQLAVLEAVAGAAVPEFAAGDTPDVGRSLEARPARRFSWLLARLADPNGTERLRV